MTEQSLLWFSFMAKQLQYFLLPPLGLLVDDNIHSEQKVAQCKINNLKERKLTASTGYTP